MIKDHTIEEKVSEFSLDYEQFLLLGEVRRASQKKFKNIKKKIDFSVPRGALGATSFFACATGFVERRDYSWQKVSCPTQQKNKIRTLR